MNAHQRSDDQPCTSAVDPETWIDHYGDKLYAYALQITRNPSLAEDLVQETFLAGLQNMKQYQGRSQECTWLFGILKHKIMDSFRKQARNKEDDVEDFEQAMETTLYENDGSWRLPPGKWDLSPLQAMERKEFVAVLQKCLEYLSARVSQVYALREIMGLSSQEICDTLNIQPNNLWTRIYRARSSLRRCLEKHWFEME